MSPIAPALAWLSTEIARLTAQLGRRVGVAALGATDRRGQLALKTPGRFSANRACGLVRAADGWIALNLARDEDRELIPAWLGAEPEADVWATIRKQARRRPASELIEGAILLGLPAGRVGEAAGDRLAPPTIRMGTPTRRAGPFPRPPGGVRIHGACAVAGVRMMDRPIETPCSRGSGLRPARA